jgi:hypothetical protein
MRLSQLSISALIIGLIATLIGACDDGGERTESDQPSSSGGAVIYIDPPTAWPDTRVTVSGCGFEPNKEYILSGESELTRGMTESDGTFLLTNAPVPSAAPGEYLVRAETSETVFAEIIYVVEPFPGEVIPTFTPGPQPTPILATC